MLKQKRIALFFAIVLAGIWADQSTKKLARDLLADQPEVTLLSGFIELRHVQNHGGFLGFLNGVPEHLRYLLLTIGVSILLIAAAWLLLNRQELSRTEQIAGSFLLAGGLSNLIDRFLFAGGVTDFLILSLPPLRTGIFNLADVFILCGAFYLGFTHATGRPVCGTSRSADS